jgi:Domain of unknown function (DUF4184)
MPFTISHAAAVLPFSKVGKSRLPLAAMMIGSMSPDFAYFLPVGMTRISTHDLDGILLFCWPVGLALWLLFVHLLERPTIELLPAAWRVRMPRSNRTVTPEVLGFASIAVILGAMTHVAWDAFTHADTLLTGAFPALNEELFTFRGRSVRIYLILQYLSSIVGLLALAIWARNLRRSSPRGRDVAESQSCLSDRARIGASLMVFMASAVTALLGYASDPGSPFEYRVFRLLIGGMTGWAVAWCVVALFIGWWSRIATRPARIFRR